MCYAICAYCRLGLSSWKHGVGSAEALAKCCDFDSLRQHLFDNLDTELIQALEQRIAVRAGSAPSEPLRRGLVATQVI
jgi:hypothetical protein